MHIIMCVPTIDVEVNLGKVPYRVLKRAIDCPWGYVGFGQIVEVFSEFADKLASCSADVCPRIGKDVNTGLPIVGGDLGSDGGGGGRDYLLGRCLRELDEWYARCTE